MPKDTSDLFQARIGNAKQKIFIDEYIKITQSRICDDMGLSKCSKGLALFTLLQENAGNNGVMKDGRLIPEYHHQEWINERLKDFDIAKQGYVTQIRILNKYFSDIMERENDKEALIKLESIKTKRDRMLFCYDYFIDNLIPKIKTFNEKYQDGE